MTPTDTKNAEWIICGNGRLQAEKNMREMMETGILEEEVETAAVEPMTAMDP